MEQSIFNKMAFETQPKLDFNAPAESANIHNMMDVIDGINMLEDRIREAEMNQEYKKAVKLRKMIDCKINIYNELSGAKYREALTELMSALDDGGEIKKDGLWHKSIKNLLK